MHPQEETPLRCLYIFTEEKGGLRIFDSWTVAPSVRKVLCSRTDFRVAVAGEQSSSAFYFVLCLLDLIPVLPFPHDPWALMSFSLI